MLRSNGCGSSTPSIWDGATPSFDLKVALSATVGCGRGSAETRSGLSTAPAHFRAERQQVDEALPHATVSCQARVSHGGRSCYMGNSRSGLWPDVRFPMRRNSNTRQLPPPTLELLLRRRIGIVARTGYISLA